MAAHLIEVQQVYDRLWAEASLALEHGQPDIDPFLSDRQNDNRRCVTLTFRPCEAVCTRVDKFLKEAIQAAPSQHVYRLDELHVTVLSVMPGSTSWRQRLPELPTMRTIISDALKGRRGFCVAFRGVTASTGGVMIQGFPADNTLAQLRDDLRSAFKQNDVGSDIDIRYRITSAHITVMRFKTPQADWSRLLTLLKANRTTEFGETRVNSIELLFSDWYAAADSVRVLEAYQLT